MLRFITLILLTISSSFVSAQSQCIDVFPDGLSTHGGASRIDFGFNAQLLNSPDNILDASRIDTNGGSTLSTCNTAQCQLSDVNSAVIDPGAFQSTNANQDINVGSGQSQTVGSGAFDNNEFDRIQIGFEASLTLSDNQSTYFIDRLDLGSSSVLNLQGGGTYWIRVLNVSSSVQVNVQGSGTATIYVNNNLTLGSSSLFNADSVSSPRESTRLALFGFGNITLNNQSVISGFVYSRNRINLTSASTIFGAASAQRIDLSSGSVVSFSQTNSEPFALGDLCGINRLVANYEFEEANPTIDGTNGNNGSFVGGAIDIRLSGANASQTCSVLDVPLNQSIGNNDGFETPVNVGEQLGDQGTISFWYRSDVQWDQGFAGLDRKLFDASLPFGNQNDNEDKFFFLVLQNNGSLLFGLEDEDDNNGRLLSGRFDFEADEWVHIAVTWDVENPLANQRMALFINGAPATTTFIENQLNAPFSQTNTLRLGDNRSSYLPAVGTSANSGDGQFDSLRLYNFAQTAEEIDSDRVASDVSVCDAPNDAAAFYQFQPPEVSSDTFDFSNGTLIGDAMGNVLQGRPGVCGVLDVPLNQSINSNDAFDTRVNIANEIGNRGTISFWYRSDEDWNLGNGGLDRKLFDASIPFGNGNDNEDRFFFLNLQSNGRLRFGLEDRSDRNGILETGVLNFSANEWVHIAATWDVVSSQMTLFINGSVTGSTPLEQNAQGALSETNTLYIGDNRSSYLPGVGTTQNSSNGQFDEVRIYRFDQTSAQILVDINAQPLGCFDDILVNHYRLNYGSSFTCAASEVNVQACANESCDVLATSNTSLRLTTDDGSFNETNLTFVGSVISELSVTSPGAVTIGADNLNPDADVRCFSNGVENNSCEVNFAEVGLTVSYGDDQNIIEIPNGVSQIPFDTEIIVGVDQTGACDAELDGRSLEVAVQCNTPGSCNVNQLRVNGVDTGNTEAFSPTGINFDANGQAIIPPNFLQYRDAGLVQLLFRDADAVTMGESNPFVMEPLLIAINQPNSRNVAGEQSSLIYEAVGAEGALTPNYDPSNLQIRVVKVIPEQDIGNPGTLTLFRDDDANPFEPGTPFLTNEPDEAMFVDVDENSFGFVAGGGRTFNLRPEYNEVGTIELLLRDENYLDTGPIDAVSIGTEGLVIGPLTLGRYLPAYFDLTANVPVLRNTCAAPLTNTPFTYIGENIPFTGEFSFTVTARNARGETTSNYGGNNLFDNGGNPTPSNLWQLEINESDEAPVIVREPDEPGLRGAETDSLRIDSGALEEGVFDPSVDGVILGSFSDNDSENNFDGEATYSVILPIITHEKTAIPESPDIAIFVVRFGSLQITNDTRTPVDDIFRLIDADGVCFQPNFPAGCSDVPEFVIQGQREDPEVEGDEDDDVLLRYGRLVFDNAFGPETENILVPFRTEFFNDQGNFVVNEADSCTQLAFSNGDFQRFSPGPGIIPLQGAIDDIVSSGRLLNGRSLPFEGITVPTANQIGGLTISLQPQNPAIGIGGQQFLNFDWDGSGNIDSNDYPSALVSFGIFRGNDRIIHWREVFGQ